MLFNIYDIILWYMIWYEWYMIWWYVIWYDIVSFHSHIHVYNVLFNMIETMKYIVIIKIFSQKVTSLSLTVNI